MSFFVAVTDSPAGDDLSVERSVLHNMRVEKVSWQKREDLVEAVGGADAILCMHAPFDAEIIGALRQCRVIARFGTGLDNIDTGAAAKAGIPVLGVHDYCTQEVANHTIALILAWNRKILDYHQFVLSERWNERHQTTGNWGCGPLTRLSEQTLGLVGFGRIAQSVAKRASAFGLKVSAWSRRPDETAARRLNVELAGRDELLARSDFVSLHLPLGEATRHIVDAVTLAALKPGAVLINTSRGGLVDEAALVQSLRCGHLGGALLDVYETAPLPFNHPLREFPNVILTPHVAFYSDESLSDLRRLAALEVRKHLNLT